MLIRVYRLPDTVDRDGRSWALWPWVAACREAPVVWERFGTRDEAMAFGMGVLEAQESAAA